MKKIFISTLAVGLLLAGCNNSNSYSVSNNSNISSSFNSSLTSNSSVTSSITSSTSSSSSFVFEGYVDLVEAIANTEEYGLIRSTDSVRPCTEIYTKDMYYNDFFHEGYVELDSDLGYIHGFTTELKNYESAESVMRVYGRNAYTENLSVLKERSIMHILNTYYPKFDKIEENIYSANNRNFTYAIAEFFQAKSYKYATEIQVVIGMDNRVSEIKIYEGDYLLHNEYFVKVNYRDLQMYKDWVALGSKVEERIYDYKSIVTVDDTYISVYENEEIAQSDMTIGNYAFYKTYCTT